ncbi:MAG: hypothetical protein ACTS3F_01815 [Phycisphaerales bacterium]
MTTAPTPTPPPHEPERRRADARHPCVRCGADLVFAPGTHALRCPYCNAQNDIAPAGQVIEHDYHDTIAALEARADTIDDITAHCNTCGADVAFPPGVTSHACCFCGSHVVISGGSTRHIRPSAMLPVALTREQAREAYTRWIAKLWFAPRDLKRLATVEGRLNAVYLPYWTYDTRTTTRYTGARGVHYWVTETYSTTDSNGRRVTRTRQVRKTRWHRAAGTVANTFDDVLIPATRSLPHDRLNTLEPWPIESLTPYNDAYLAGFAAQTYAITLPEGFELAKARIEPDIRHTIRRDIGGDEQRIDSIAVHYNDITYKHILLPVWLAAYRYKQRLYHITVNAITAEVTGDRPYSALKITLAILTVLLIAALIATGIALTKGP